MRFLSIGLVLMALLATACLADESDGPRQPAETITIPELSLAEIGPRDVELPSDAVRVSVGDDLARLASDSAPGTRFLLESGVHRISTVKPKQGQEFVGSPGTVLSGAVEVTGFVPNGQTWVAQVDVANATARGRCRDDAPGCRFPEQVFVDEVRWERVATGFVPSAGQWSLTDGLLTLGEDPGARQVELSHIPHAFLKGGSDVRIAGMIIEKFAPPAQSGAVHAEGSPGWVIEDSEIRYNHGAGLTLGPAMTVRHNHLHHNGQFGINGSGTDVLVEFNEISFNNVAGFNPQWAAGGTKFVMTKDLVVRNNYVHDNDGPGLWTDIDNERALISTNTVVDNGHAGIKHEISFEATIDLNLVVGNGFDHPVNRRGAGILVRESPGVDVTNNQVLDNAHGIVAIQESRPPGPRGEYRLEALTVVGNTIDLGYGSTGVIENVGDSGVFSERGITFQGNTYLRAEAGHPFLWAGESLDLDGWHAAGNDT